MDTSDCSYLVLSNYCLLSNDADRLFLELGNNWKGRSAHCGELSNNRSAPTDIYVFKYLGVRHSMALGEIWGSNNTRFSIYCADFTSNSKTYHSGFLLGSDPLHYVVSDFNSWSNVLCCWWQSKKRLTLRR